MSAQHTPGPWFPLFEQEDDFDGIRIEAWGREDFVEVANVPVDYDDREQREANARLIAAAPELLAVCRAMIPRNICLNNGNVRDDLVVPLDVTMGELRRVAAAIAKAEGRA